MSNNQIFASILLFAIAVSLIWRKQQSPGQPLDDAQRDQDSHEQAWWIIITTNQPKYEYFFGPFDSREHAIDHQSGYVQDLADEGATDVKSLIRWCQPSVITSEVS